MTEALSEVDRRIVGALQIDGRAPWSAVAAALGEPLRTVTRRGRALLDAGAVKVAGLANHGPTCVIEITCRPDRIEAIAEELSTRSGIVFLMVLANPSSLLVEVHEQTFDLATMTLQVIPSFDGVKEVSATPVLHYYKTNSQWQPTILSREEAMLLSADHAPNESTADVEELDAADQAIADTLERDGRAGIAELAVAAGVTEPTARKRLQDLLARGGVTIRTLVRPQLLGFRFEACLRVECSPIDADAVGLALAAVPEVRYVTHVLGQYPLVAHVNARDLPHLRELLAGEWIQKARSMRSSLVTRVYRRGGHPVV